MPNDIVIRFYRKGDEEGIVNAINSSFGSFRDFGLNKDIWLNYSLIDEGFKEENAVVAEVDGKIVGHIQIIDRDLSIGDNFFVKNGGIANVCTMPEYRGRGIASRMMEKALEKMIDEKYLISSLFTGYFGNAHRIYRRYRYGDTFFSYQFSAKREEIEKILKNMRDFPSIKVENYVEGCEEDLIKVYERWGKGYSGIVRRSRKYWIKKFFERASFHTFFYLPFDSREIYIAYDGEKVVGYGYILTGPRRLTPDKGRKYITASIREIVYDPRDKRYLLALLYRILNDVYEIDKVKNVDVLLPPYPEYIIPLRGFKIFIGDGVFMVNILDLIGLLRNMTTLFNERIGDLNEPLSNIDLSIKSIYGELTIKYDGDKVTVNKGILSENIFEIDYHLMTKMIFGIKTFGDGIYDGDIRIVKSNRNIGEIIAFMDTIFPENKFHIWSSDHW